MDGIVALGHFCENHGPCVIFCTQRFKEEPSQTPPSHALVSPVCSGCSSLSVDQALASKKGDIFYVTTRAPLEKDTYSLVKQAIIRSLTCEFQEESFNEGMVYFGDSERGHVISHTFSLQDSLARGFKRKYCILVFMKHKLCLLNSWTHFTKTIRKITHELQEKANKLNEAEQIQISQRAARETLDNKSNRLRSLPELLGEFAIFGQLHMWFTFLLSAEIFTVKNVQSPSVPVNSKPTALKQFAKELDAITFRTIAYCILTSIKLDADEELVNAFSQLLPSGFSLSTSGDVCKVIYIDGKWNVEWSGQLPPRLPTLLTKVEKILKDENFPEAALEPYLTSIIYQWYNKSCALKWASKHTNQLYQALGIQTHDMPLVSHWITQCKDPDFK